MTDSQAAPTLDEPTRIGRRLSAMTVDQAVAGASNVLVTVLAARTLSATGFGLFGIVFLSYVFTQSTTRALVSEPLLVHPREAEERPGDPLGAGVLLGLGVGAAVVLIGAVVLAVGDAHLGAALLVLGFALPLLTLQDLGRYVAFTVREPGRALLLDVVWLVLMVPPIVLVMASGHADAGLFTAAWLVPGAAAGLLVVWRHRTHRLRPSARWLRETWAFSWRYFLSFGATYGSALAASLGLSAIAGAAALGGVRGALLVVRPFSAFFTAVVAGSVTDVARHGLNGERLRRRAGAVSAFLAVVAVGNAALLLWLPDVLGRALLGATWEQAHRLLVPAAVQILLMGAWAGARAGLLGTRAVRTTVRLDLASVPLSLIAAVTGAVAAGGVGYYWGTATAQLVVTAAWWAIFWRRTRMPEHGDAS
jgi:O-antigen/teichoic acid export membrane protein